VKVLTRNLFGEEVPTLYVKASGTDLAEIGPQGFSGLDLARLRPLSKLDSLGDEEMVRQLRAALLDYRSANPSIEALVHAFLPATFIDHTHADAILALSNQPNGRQLIREALGGQVIVLDYVKPGFLLAKATADAVQEKPDAIGAVWLRHGLVTWGESAGQSYDRMIELVGRAECALDQKRRPLVQVPDRDVSEARSRWAQFAPTIRGLLSERSGNDDRPHLPVILQVLNDRETLAFLATPGARELAVTPPVTSDHLIRTKPLPLWVQDAPFEEPAAFRSGLKSAIDQYRKDYLEYISRHGAEPQLPGADTAPRVILIPGLGAICSGSGLNEAVICRDITRQTLQIKAQLLGWGDYRSLSEQDLFEMEYRGLQTAKLRPSAKPLGRNVALVTGAAGAIGAGICRKLLDNDCLVAASDISPERLELLKADLKAAPDKLLTVHMDVTDPTSVSAAFQTVVETWGGIDIVVVNAGVAHVSSLAELQLETFRKLERVNTEGTLLAIAEAARHFEKQGIGGDIVLISTKNVFAPGARFGAYSATKAAAHQLARIASLELAPIGVRVNMVAPDAIFGEGNFKSGLWAEVGPDRMRARGLDEASLQEYYRSRNLLKIRVTADHVANAVLFFVLRETPTTGATIPIDGGLPDSTPR